MVYKDELTRSMTWLGKQPDTLFLGQAVQCSGTAMTGTLKDIPPEKLIEMPVCEDMQMGISTGLALNGFTPISIFPRWNFLLLATNQLVNHLDKVPLMADSPFRPKVIIRTGIGSEYPLHPQYQHVGDFTEAFRFMCKTINIVRLDEPEQIFEAYCKAYASEKPTILIEWSDAYDPTWRVKLL